MFSRHMVVAAQSQHILASCRNQGDAKTYEVRCFFDTQNSLRKKHLKDFEYSGNWKNMLINFHHRFHMIPIKLPPQMCIQLSKSRYFTIYICLFNPFYTFFHLLFINLSSDSCWVGWTLTPPPTSAEWGRESTSLVSILLTNLGRWDIRGERPERPVDDLLSIELRDWYVRFHCFFSSISLISFPLAVCIRRYIRTLGNSFSNRVLAAPCCRNPKKLEVRTT